MTLLEYAIIAGVNALLGYYFGHKRGVKRGWAYCENYFIRKVGEEIEELEAK